MLVIVIIGSMRGLTYLSGVPNREASTFKKEHRSCVEASPDQEGRYILRA